MWLKSLQAARAVSAIPESGAAGSILSPLGHNFGWLVYKAFAAPKQ